MDIDKTVKSLENRLYKVTVFDNSRQAADYLNDCIDGRTVGFGDSRTLIDMHMFDMLSSHNTVYDPNQSTDEEGFIEIARAALTTEVFLTSVNAMAETGEMINIDGTGNRVAGSLFGHDKVYFVVGTNKITPDLSSAIHRARNVASPLNALKYDLPTPCVSHYRSTGELQCFDCRCPERICNGILTYEFRMNDMQPAEVILINEDLGF